MHQISADSSDQLWAIIRQLENDCFVNKFAKRIGINSHNRIGNEWEIINKYVNCLQYICRVDKPNNETNDRKIINNTKL